MKKVIQFFSRLLTGSIAFNCYVVAFIYLTYTHIDLLTLGAKSLNPTVDKHSIKISTTQSVQENAVLSRNKAVERVADEIPEDSSPFFDYGAYCLRTEHSKPMTLEECLNIAPTGLAKRQVEVNAEKPQTIKPSQQSKSSLREKMIYKIFYDIPGDPKSNFDVGRYCLRIDETHIVTFDECLNIAAAKLSRALRN
ncbi:hypothetical protein [Marinobacter sp. V034]|uniref:hypothetical protein n=1 Tax=Marinobacter sp. V034 TaxID=3459610 RepID=UPI004043BFE8